jgi:hypothetical protein
VRVPALFARRPLLVAGAVAVVVVVVVVAAGAAGHGGGQRAMSRRVSVTAGPVTAVDLQAVPGHLSVASTASGQAALTGVLSWTGHSPPAAAARRSGRRLSLSYTCGRASPCTADWQLVVPRRAAVTLDVPGGYLSVTGLAGPLRITASSVDVSAAGLACPLLYAAITSGHLGAVFRAAPQRVSITVTSAQATLTLPASVTYAVSEQVTSGYVQAAIPESGSSSRTVTATVTSGEIALLPGGR